MNLMWKEAPFIKTKLTTQSIMFKLTLALLVVYLFGLYQAYNLGFKYLINGILMMVVAVSTSVLIESLYALITGQKVLKFLRQSFPLVTPIIFVLTLPINTSLYAVFIATAFAVFLAKLAFGGFGQNIFNPAAIARAVIFVGFATSFVPDIITSQTPVTTINGAGWLMYSDNFQVFLNDFGGLLNLGLGNYSGSIGETSTILIVLLGIYLAYEKVIDWIIPTFYVTTIFITTTIIALVYGLPLTYGLMHISIGGVMFGAVFMLTDPVTSPVTRSGKILFSILAAFLTLLIRFFGNAPEGVLFSILISNMFVLLIEKLFDHKQVAVIKRNALILSVSMFLTTTTMTLLASKLPIVEKYKTILRPNYNRGATVKLDSDFSQFEAELLDKKEVADKTVYKIRAKGYGLIEADSSQRDHYGYNVYEITVNKQDLIEEVKVLEFKDTKGIGDLGLDQEFIRQLTGLGLKDEIDVVSHATFTSKSLLASANLALKKGQHYESKEKLTLSHDPKLDEYLKDIKVEKIDPNKYLVKVNGYAQITHPKENELIQNTFEIEVDKGIIKAIKVIELNDTKGIGDQILNPAYLKQFINKKLDDQIDVLSSASYTAKSLLSACLKVLEESVK